MKQRVRYRKVSVELWNDEKFRALSDDGKLVFIFCITHPNMTPLGAMRANLPGLAAELGWVPERLSKGFREGLSKGMVELDEKASCIGCPNFLKHNRPESPNVVRSWVMSATLIPECPIKTRSLQRAYDLSKGMGKAFFEAFKEAFPKGFPKDMPKDLNKKFVGSSGNQEQEQEQEQDNSYTRPTAALNKSNPRNNGSKAKRNNRRQRNESDGQLFDGAVDVEAQPAQKTGRRNPMDDEVFGIIRRPRDEGGLGLDGEQVAKAGNMIKGKGHSWSPHKLAALEFALNEDPPPRDPIAKARGHMKGRTAVLPEFEALVQKWAKYLDLIRRKVECQGQPIGRAEDA